MNMSVEQNVNADTLNSVLAQHRKAYNAEPATSKEFRVDLLKKLKVSLIKHQTSLIAALEQDYGQRPAQDTLISEIMPSVMNINYTIKRLKKWMKPQRRHAGLLLSPASVKVHYQPLGVIGIVVPWNFPIMLALGPLISVIAAGNRAMIKLSEFTPATNKALIAMFDEVFEPNMVSVTEGEADVAALFTQLPFDHLIFSGSTAVGRHVMRAAAENLTPVTLELGGKSPVIVAPDMPIKTAIKRLIYGKCLNSGQICVAPDYIFCPEDKINEFITEYKKQFQLMYGSENNSSDYGNIINDAQYSRLSSWLDDAIEKGAKVTSANDQTIDPNSRNLATQLVTNVNDSMLLMQHEIFGPVLPIIGYQSIDECVEYINNNPRPLALYIMSFDKKIQQHLLDHTHSGGVCINETIMHVAADDAPFGGVGASGMGHYHGKEGFLTMSKAKTVLNSGKINLGSFVHPPYNSLIQKILLKVFIR